MRSSRGTRMRFPLSNHYAGRFAARPSLKKEGVPAKNFFLLQRQECVRDTEDWREEKGKE